MDEATDWQIRLENPSADAEAGFAAWVAADPRHRQVYDAVRANWALSEQLVEAPAGHDRKLVRAPFLLRRSTHLAAGMLAGVAAAACLVVAVANLNGQSAIVSAKAATYATRTGEIRTITLVDGLRVTLDTDSVLRTNGEDRREVTLVRGRARFTVPRAGETFTVQVPAGQVQSSGSVFDVSLVGVRAVVGTLEGEVELHVPGKAGRAAALAGGQESELASGAVATALPRGQLLWVKGMLVFDAAPLDQAVSAINRYNRAKLVVGSPHGNYRVTGAFSAHDPEAFALAVAALFPLALERGTHGSMILRPR